MSSHGLKYSGLVPKDVRDEIEAQIPTNVSGTVKRLIQRELLRKKGFIK